MVMMIPSTARVLIRPMERDMEKDTEREIIPWKEAAAAAALQCP